MGRPLAPPATVSRNHGALARRDQAWSRRRRQDACAVSPLLSRPMMCPAVEFALPLAPSHSPSPLRGWCWCSNWCPGVVGELPSPPPPYVRRRHSVALRVNLELTPPHGATLPLRGCRCSLATRFPLPLPGNPPQGFPPLRRPQGPPLPLSLLRTHRTGFPASQKTSTFPAFPPPEGLPFLLRLRLQRHRWELPGNYRDFIVVMVFYLLCRRTKIILVTATIGFNFSILLQSLMLFI